jgi:uncharacterized protein
MSTQTPFTIEQFYKYLTQEKLMASKCQKCGKIHLPPRPICDNCYGQEFDWVEIPGEGKLLTYTIIHVAPPQFQAMAPYIVGIVQLKNDLKLPGMVSGVPENSLKIGMALSIDFKACSVGQTWPQWPRYCFKPLQIKL